MSTLCQLFIEVVKIDYAWPQWLHQLWTICGIGEEGRFFLLLLLLLFWDKCQFRGENLYYSHFFPLFSVQQRQLQFKHIWMTKRCVIFQGTQCNTFSEYLLFVISFEWSHARKKVLKTHSSTFSSNILTIPFIQLRISRTIWCITNIWMDRYGMESILSGTGNAHYQ